MLLQSAGASRSRAFAAFALVACAGCQESVRPPTDGMATHRVRHMEETHWLVDTLIGGEPDDTTLLIPGLMAFQNGHLLVYDYGDARLKVFGPDGTWLWSFGRFGDGPGEFRNPTDVMVGADGLVWVLDRGAGRITRISPSGEFFDLITLGASIWRFLPTADQVLVFPADVSDVFFRTVSLSGSVGGSTEYPTQQIRDADSRLRVVEVDASQTGSWAAGFSMADFFLSYRDDELQCTGRLTVRAPVDRQWVPADYDFGSLVDIGWQRGGLEVYSRAPSDSTQVFIDRYRADDCEYEASTLLSVPGLVAAVVPGDDSYFILSREPVPAVYRARRVPR